MVFHHLDAKFSSPFSDYTTITTDTTNSNAKNNDGDERRRRHNDVANDLLNQH